MTKRIPLTQGKFALVDDEDFEYLNQWKWCYDSHNGYAVRNSRTLPRRLVRMARVIANTPEGMVVDHINLDRLDNRRCNLRNCTMSQNLTNKKAKKNNKSGYKGVSLHKQSGLWKSEICLLGHRQSCGYYKTPEEAARAYDTKARELFGEFARTNF